MSDHPGAPLGCKDWLELLPDVYVKDIDHWARGKSDDCVVRLQPCALTILGEDGTYQQF